MTSSLAVGTHTITAAYGGDGGNNPSTSPGLTQVVAGSAPGIATIITNPYGAITVQGATLNGNTISNFQANAVIQLGTTPGAAGVAAEIDWQGLNLGNGVTLTIRSGAAGQALLMKDTSGSASAIAGTLRAQGGNGAPPPVLYVANAAGFAIAATGSVQSPSGLTVDALAGAWNAGQNIVNAGVVDGGGAARALRRERQGRRCAQGQRDEHRHVRQRQQSGQRQLLSCRTVCSSIRAAARP